MRVPVCLLLALALGARAASIPTPNVNLDKKLADVAQEALKDPEPQNAASEPELVDQTNVIKDVENKLKSTIDAIPVKVVVEDVKPALKSGEKECDKPKEDADDNIKRAEIDLKHPGEPQRQEHDNQTPEPNEGEVDAVAKIKQLIKNTQSAFNDGVQDISNGINEWLHDNKPEVSIKESIEKMQETFTDQINKLNSTIRSYWNADQYKDVEKPVGIKNVESGLKVLENNFESGVGNLRDGVHVLAALKSEIRDTATSSTTAKPGNNPIFPFFQSFYNGITENFGNLTTQVQNFFNTQGNNSSAAAAGVQADEVATQRPGLWQGFQNSIQGILNRPGQQQGVQSDEPAPTGPLAQVIQNNPFVQGVINFIQPKPQQPAPQPAKKPAETASDAAQSTVSEGSNAVPEKPEGDQQQKEKPVQAAQPAPEQPAQPQTQPGPIQQILQKNPIVQGVQGAVQKLQQNIMNPERPREEVIQSEKGGFYHGGHHGNRPADEHNNDVNSSGVVKSVEAVKEVASVEKPKEVQREVQTPVKQD